MSSEAGKRTLRPVAELCLGAHGGADYLFADIDGDGALEALAYQGPGVFGAKPYCDRPEFAGLLPQSACVSAFRLNGERLWTWGRPHTNHGFFLSHSYESCMAAGDVDGDGATEVVVADGSRVVMLEGSTGREKRSASLPHDWYYIVQVAGQPTRPHEAAVVLKNGEAGEPDWRYGEPVLGLNAALQPVWGPKVILGGGHHMLSLDLNGDGRREYLIGYCAVAPDGRVLWTVEGRDPSAFDPYAQHVDHTDTMTAPDGETLFAMAGSDRLFLVRGAGRTVFSLPHLHCQGSAIGRFRRDSPFQVALYNSPSGPLVLYDPSGREIWSRPIERTWPMGEPAGVAGRRFHRNRPITALRGADRSWIAFADGGWPWAVDGNGERVLDFEAPAASVQPPWPNAAPMNLRADDIGYGFGLQCLDIDGDGQNEALIHDRAHLWVYRLD